MARYGQMIETPGVFRNYLAGRQAGQAEEAQGYQNALMRERIADAPVEREFRQQQMQMAGQQANDQRVAGAQKLVGQMFAAVGQSQSPKSAAQQLLSNPTFRSAAQLVGLPVDQLSVTDQDTDDSLRSEALNLARGFGFEVGATEQAPASVREFQFAKQNGYQGSFQDWITAGGQTSRPSAVQEWEFYNSLPADQKPVYLEMKRNPNMSVKDVAGAPSVVAPTVVGGTSVTPLSTPDQENAAAQARKAAETVGAAQGAIQGGIETKGANAVGTINLLDIADSLIDVATGSATGAARDAVVAFFGSSTGGSEAIAQLKVLQAGLMTQMPRMEGPQSDRDVQLYREAAGQIGDSTVPAAQKKAAVGVIRQIQQKYIDRANGGTSQPPPQQQAPQAAIDYLRQHPELAEQFRAKYGYLP